MTPTEKTPQATRTVKDEIEIAAPVEAVWRALTEAEELKNWFPIDARITPGAGGEVWLAWEDLYVWEQRIEIWEPRVHLRTTYVHKEPGALPEAKTEAAAAAEIAIDYYLEPREGTTVVRVVHSGFGADADWDNEYYGVMRGWNYELKSLRHYLENHPGVVRHVVWAKKVVELATEEAWETLMGAEGVLAEGILVGLKPDAPYSFRTAAGHMFRGVVRTMHPPFEFSGTVENLSNALLRVSAEPWATGALVVGIWIATYGLSEARVDELQSGLQRLLERLFQGSDAHPTR